MRWKTRSNIGVKNIISALLALVMFMSVLAPISGFAAQSNEYVDPADKWLSASGRTNELDANATVTYETSYCCVCEKDTTVLTYRVPEYTKSGETALNRGVRYSDGTCLDGVSKGNMDEGTPGKNAYYSGYHWTKSVCQNCGTINAIEGPGWYNYNTNVYALNSCDYSFFLDFDATTYETHNKDEHIAIVKSGQYCQFCKGTFARATRETERHNFIRNIDGQIGDSRFYVAETCEDCGYNTSKYITAKSVVASYYGEVDGNAHTVTVSDLSESGVHTSIRYGTSAERCNLTSAPNYTEAGYYPVYYEIDYQYGRENMTENGVSYVWLLEKDGDTIIIVPPVNTEEKHTHDYRYVETIAPSCESLGYERWQCDGCGRLEKRNYIPATGHKHKAITVREATCRQSGLKLYLCEKCGDFYEESTSVASHKYRDVRHNATCRTTGCTEHVCEVCGDNYITDITPIISHSFERITKQPTCTDKGYTTSTCTMCGLNYVSDYTEPTGHDWDEGHTVTNSTCDAEGVIEFNCKNCTEKMIKATDATGHTAGTAATCTEPQVCEKCGTVLELPTGHHYDSEIVEPTCTAMGYTVYTCRDCADSYTGDYTDKADHDYNTVLTAPTCTQHGYTTYSCKNCDDEYISDYTEKLAHNYTETVTNPTCTTMGYSTYTCVDCGDNYVGNYTDMLEHNYNKETVEPTCTEHGYAVYTCPDCGKSYIGDYTNCKEHHYTETVIAPTCTEMGYSVFKCDDCGDEYKGNYTDKIAHSYDETVTEPTCLELGFTTFVCSVCGDSYKSEYTEALGHKPTEWIIDTEATIEHAGSKHIECERCGDVLQTVELPQLVDKDHSDEDGNAKVGAFSIILTDKDEQPVFDSEITIDVTDNVTIKLPSSRLLDYAEQTTITAFYTDTQEPAQNLRIFIFDENNNAATGATDGNGQLKVPNNQSSTGDDNGTVGKDEDDEKFTFVVRVTDKSNVVIPNCDVYIGESNNIVVDLPAGIKPSAEFPVIVTVTDQSGTAQRDVTIIALGDNDYIEKGKTDIYGRITLPMVSEGFTNNEGHVTVDNINVIVTDETGLIANAFVKHNEDGSISVILPEGKSISHANRTTVTVLDSEGLAIEGVNITVTALEEKSYSNNTDASGKIVVPPLSEDYSDENGMATVNGYNVLITDETKPIANAFVEDKDGTISVTLPEGANIDYHNRITATITDKDGSPVKDVSVNFTDTLGNSEANLTDENGKATVPPTNIDYTDINGFAQVDGYYVIVKDEKGFVEKAFVTHTEDDKIDIKLPDNLFIQYSNRITVQVLNKDSQAPVKDIVVTINEVIVPSEPDTEVAAAKTMSGKTDSNGIVVFPPLSEDITDNEGGSTVTDKEDEEGKDTDGDGIVDQPGETIETQYNVSVKDTKGIIPNAFVKVVDGKIQVTLPDSHTLTTSNQTTVTVLDKDSKPVSGISVTIKDKNNTSKTGTTNSNGQVTLPVKSSGSGGGGSSRPSGGGSGGGGSSSSTTVTVVDKDGKTVSVSKSINNAKATLTLPAGKDLSKDDNYYEVTVKFGSKAKADYPVTLKDRNGNEVSGITDDHGTLILPGVEHKAYIFGYPDGAFRPNGNMTRSEAAAIFARLIAEAKNETISGKSSFKDVNSGEWYASYVAYLEKYNVLKGYSDHTFRADNFVTRAEFVAMSVRYYDLFKDLPSVPNTKKYSDVSPNYWAVKDISIAKEIGWLNGYADGTFRGDNEITRAEAVTVINRATNRTPDKVTINTDYTKLNRFTDVTDSSAWFFYDVMEACNTHLGASVGNSESWIG